MSIIPYPMPELGIPVRVDLLPGTLGRARAALAESDDLISGSFLSDPNAPAVFGRLQAALSELLRYLPEVTR